MPFDTATTTETNALPLGHGVTLIPHTREGYAAIRAGLRALGPAGVEYRQAITGVGIWLKNHRREQERARLDAKIKARGGAGIGFDPNVAATRSFVLKAVARARRAAAVIAGPVVEGVA